MATITDPVSEIVRSVRTKFSDDFDAGRLYSLGVYNRRYIAGTSIWSQHSWGNAWDIGVHPDHRPDLGNEVLWYIRGEDRAGRLDVGTILWQVRDHYDHLHVEGDPKKTGTPPVPTKEDDNMEKIVEGIQTELKEAGFDPGPIDGLWGPKTQAGFSALCKAAAESGGGLNVGDTVKLSKP